MINTQIHCTIVDNTYIPNAVLSYLNIKMPGASSALVHKDKSSHPQTRSPGVPSLTPFLPSFPGPPRGPLLNSTKRVVRRLPGKEYRSTLLEAVTSLPYPRKRMLTLPSPIAVFFLEVFLLHGHPPLVLAATGAAAPQQPVHRPVAGSRLDVPVPGALEDRQLRLGVEVLPSARRAAVRRVSVFDQHFLYCTETKTARGERDFPLLFHHSSSFPWHVFEALCYIVVISAIVVIPIASISIWREGGEGCT